MARKPRLYGMSGIYHVILRGNNKQNLFNDESDRYFFLKKLKKYSEELDVVIYAYCLMNNHVHLLIGNASENMSLFVQKIANSYVYFFNRKYERTGHLFQGRFKSEPVSDDTYFKVVYRYILQNCEKACLGKVDEYKWNSYNLITDLKLKSFVDVEYVIALFGSQKTLVDYLLQHDERKCMEYENLLVISDGTAVNLIKKLFKISTPYKLERLNIDDQISKCSILRKHGLSMNQISRITGISKSIIRKANL
ncbi:transposase [Treponema sp.]|uniref:transposase n=1 Tax=Treponema sp. TaxID=166 RepID=UPI00298E5786|nr:transposase [Treponema sp.]MCQ2241598.1 transposase [Treponema sp.]